MILTGLAALTLLFVATLLVVLVRGGQGLPVLGDLPAPEGIPSVSVVIAARDEARGIEAALRSVLAQDHPQMDITVVDDRSTDATPAILARLAAAHPRLRVLRVDALPPDWLGKNHALHQGAAAATGELILFTDADVEMAPSAVRLAAGHLQTHGLDHLAVAPRVTIAGWLGEVFLVFFGVMFTLFTRPWRVGDPDDPAHVGIGAFNLIRRGAYQAVGGHERIRLRPDDDVKLGKLVKRFRLRQGFAIGVGLVAVAWYDGAGEAVRGLRKNAFAGIEYRLGVAAAATLLLTATMIWPFAAVLMVGGAARWLYLAAVLLLVALYAGAARRQRLSPWRGVAWPLAAALFIVVLWNSAIYTLRHQGIEWRGTHYPLDALRRNRV